MAYLFAFCACLSLTLVMEFFFKPRPLLFFKRKLQSLLVLGLLILSLFTFALVLTQRPYFSSSLTVLGFFVVLMVNNAKFKTLREPLVFSDFFLYLQAIKHPRLYLPFLGVIPLIILILVVVVIAFAGFYFEAASYPIFSLGTLGVVLVFIASVLTLKRVSLRVEISADVLEDNHRLGILATLCCYGAQAASKRSTLEQDIRANSPYAIKPKSSVVISPLGLSDIVIVQSESFFDARVLTDNIKTDVLAEYDQCLLESACHGRLEVPAWGANTMRTEFAFLTGLEPQTLGLAQFYPYQQLVNMKLPSLVSELKSKGYWCVCVHPNASSFFMRDEFFKKLGFDEFVDADKFVGAKREGPYVSDLEVSEKIKLLLNETGQPCFVFAITMENHGPLHLENVSYGEWEDYYKQEPHSALTDLTVYLRHLKNADAMIKQQLAFHKARERDTVFGFYGDHVPAISKVFDTLEYDDPRSNYFIWSSTQVGGTNSSAVNVESLGMKVLKLAGALAKERT